MVLQVCFVSFFVCVAEGRGAQKWAENPTLWQKVNPVCSAMTAGLIAGHWKVGLTVDKE